MISVYEIGVFCDRTVLADTLLFAKNYVKLQLSNNRILSSGFRRYNNTSFRKCQPCRAKIIGIYWRTWIFSIVLIYGQLFGILHAFFLIFSDFLRQDGIGRWNAGRNKPFENGYPEFIGLFFGYNRPLSRFRLTGAK